MEDDNGGWVLNLVETLKFPAIHAMAASPDQQTSKPLVAVTHKSKTSFKTLDIMFKLPSRALNSTSWDWETAPHAPMFWTASTTGKGDQREDPGMSKGTYEPCLKELGPVDIMQRLVLPRVVPPNKCTYHETHICTRVEES